MVRVIRDMRSSGSYTASTERRIETTPVHKRKRSETMEGWYALCGRVRGVSTVLHESLTDVRVQLACAGAGACVCACACACAHCMSCSCACAYMPVCGVCRVSVCVCSDVADIQMSLTWRLRVLSEG